MSKVQRTSALTLTVVGSIGVITGRVARPVIEMNDGIAPTVGWGAAGTLFFAAAVLGTLAWNTYQQLHRQKRRMTSDRGVRLLALAKASAVVGALFAGAYLGYALAFADSLDTDLGRQRAIRSAAAALAGLLVMTAALFLERACAVRDDDDDEGKAKGAAPHPA